VILDSNKKVSLAKVEELFAHTVS